MNQQPDQRAFENALDQASELRKLVIRSIRQQAPVAGPAPRLIVVGAGKSGVGATTTAFNLSVAFAEYGSRVVVVDADLSCGGVTRLCGLTRGQSLGDVLFARRDIHEVLQRGPAGIQVVPGLFSPRSETEWTDTAQQRLLRQLRTLGRHADVVILDSGNGGNRFLRRCCENADDTLFVTTADNAAVVETYTCVKSALGGSARRYLELVVNQCNDSSVARDVHRRIDKSCRRFLGHTVQFMAMIPTDPCVSHAAEHSLPFVIASPSCPAALAVSRLAASMAKQSSREIESTRNTA
jgi:flagellar biosynthesis protein FlhG